MSNRKIDSKNVSFPDYNDIGPDVETALRNVGGQNVSGFNFSATGSNVTRSLQDKLEDNFVNVKDFGAKGDGVTDDTQDIQDALEYAQKNNKAIFIPPTQNYYIISSLQNYNSNNIYIYSKQAKIKHKNDTTNDLLYINEEDNPNIIIKNINFVGNKDNNDNELILLNLKGKNISIKECIFEKSLNKSVNIREVEELCNIKNNTFKNMSEHTGIFSTSAVRIRGNNYNINFTYNFIQHLNDISETGKAPGGIFISGEHPSMNISHNTFVGIGQNYEGNILGNIDLYTDSDNTQITDNKFYNFRYTPLKLQNAGNLNVDNNIGIGVGQNFSSGNFLTIQPISRENNKDKYNFNISNLIVEDLDLSTKENIAINIQGDTSETYKTGKINFNNIIIGKNCNYDIAFNIKYIQETINISNVIIENVNKAFNIEYFKSDINLTNISAKSEEINFYCRNNDNTITKLNISNSNLENNNNYCITARDIKTCKLRGNDFISDQNDVFDFSNVENLIITNNNSNISSPSSIVANNLINDNNIWNL